MRLGYAHFNYVRKNKSRCFWLASIVYMRWAKVFWDYWRWHELAEFACVCRQFRRTRIVMLIKGCTARATKYWQRLELMNACRQTCTVMERIMWYHDVRMSGNCSMVLQRIGEMHDVGWIDGELAAMYPVQ